MITWPNQRPCLSTFVGEGSWLIFELLDIYGKPEWLKIPSDHWQQFEEYRKMKEFVTNLPVINDSAERAMALIKKYVNNVKDEEDKQDLIQVIQRFRQKMDDYSKNSLKNV